MHKSFLPAFLLLVFTPLLLHAEYDHGASLFSITNSSLPVVTIDPAVGRVSIDIDAFYLHRTGNIFSKDDNVQLIAKLTLYSDTDTDSSSAIANKVFSAKVSDYSLGQVSIPLGDATLFHDYHLTGIMENTSKAFYVTKMDLAFDIKKNTSDTTLVNILKGLSAASTALPLPTLATNITKDVASTFTTLLNNFSDNSKLQDAAPDLPTASVGIEFGWDGSQWKGKTGSWAVIFGKFNPPSYPDDSKELTLEQIGAMTLTYDPRGRTITGAVPGGQPQRIYNDFVVINITQDIEHPPTGPISQTAKAAFLKAMGLGSKEPSQALFSELTKKGHNLDINKFEEVIPEFSTNSFPKKSLSDADMDKLISNFNALFSKEPSFK